ncbi:hypothetical protein BKA67DRAFT_684197 [Truncatella angustata]|uniref:Uncharacterized protein n=1 Tax=Truncatella angustata TaxID=152316 RepID=A0A9P8UC10_9PEZI|nr:uncharacterized protein BKA67DRAFT_684197 [Truncatella angustata]KAH6646802.1 hypothetical protein BKA67DRAFT_684197 [Truncatella angustata]
MWSGAPYKDHWAYWVRSHVNSAEGVLIHAAGDVMNGFRSEFKRHHDFRITGNPPDEEIPLQLVESRISTRKPCQRWTIQAGLLTSLRIEASAYKMKAPEKSLNAANDSTKSGTEIKPRNCQT